MVWAILLIVAIAFWPNSMVWGLSRIGYLLLFGLGLCVAWVAFFG
jgi:hypothetical protein